MSRTSALLSLVLRRRPEVAGVALDPGGWVARNDLLAGLAAAGHPMDGASLGRTVAESDERRTMSPDGRRIRAAQRHSVTVDLGLASAEPPEALFHGTVRASLDAIRAQGLRPGRRRHVHVSGDRETAPAVGRRRGPPVVVHVAAGAMFRAGGVFWRADNGVWLTGHVPAERLQLAL